MPSKENAERLIAQLLEIEISNTCGQESRHNYLNLHQARFADTLQLCQSEVPDPAARVLDIGRSELTAYLAGFYRNICTLGLDPSIDDGGHRELTEMDAIPHITFDLLNSNEVSNWPDSGSFDLIIFSEVIEHLCVAPEFVLGALSSMLADQGVLICSTPNAANAAKRIRLALGRNPYERLRLHSTNPGHVREYTRQELCEIADSVGLTCKNHSYRNWIQGRNGNRIKDVIAKLLRVYPPFRASQICVLAKKEAISAAP